MKRSYSVCWFAGGIPLCCLFVTTPVQAQIVPDATLPDNSSVTQGKTKTINGGTRAGRNLFHSFEQFSVPTGSVAYFNNAQDIQNIISRVTGSSVSEIDGTLRAKGTADLFLLNPNGIVFGPNASLNIGGSFLASTASSLNFADGTSFNTTDPQITESLLTVSVPIGLQFGKPAASIQVQEALLQVPTGKTLGLLGGDLTLTEGEGTSGAVLVAEGGRIELGSVAGVVTPDLAPVQVSLSPVKEGWTLGYKGVPDFDNIQLSQSVVVASSEGGGDIQVQGGSVTLTNESFIFADTLGSQNGGEIFIRASRLDIENLSFVRSFAGSSGKGGNVTIETGKLRALDGGEVFTGALDKGPGGTLTVTASDSVELVGGTIPAEDEFIPSGLFTLTEGAGAAGNLVLKTGKLIVREGAQVSTTTFGAGRAGDLTVRASEIELDGDALSADGQLLTDEDGLPIPSGLFTSARQGSTGNGGTLTVTTDRLSLQNGAIVQTSTFSDGDAGNLTIQALKSVELAGKAKGSQFPTSIIALSGGYPGTELPGIPEATGRGGNVTIKTGELLVQDEAEVAVSSLNETNEAKGAGNLDVQAQTFRLDNQGELKAETASGDGGNIKLQVPDLLLLRRNSNISTSAGIAGKGGDGGDITINTNNIVALGNSNIRANAYTGKGGNILITTEGVFRSSDSDITASSELGIDGVVKINTPDVDPSEGLATLPTEPVNAEIAQDCQAGSGKGTSRFISSGSGGLPTNPYEPLGSGDILADVQPPTQWADEADTGTRRHGDKGVSPRQQRMPLHRVSSSAQATPPNQIVEAQGWSTNKKGEVVLVAEVPQGPSQRGCRLH